MAKKSMIARDVKRKRWLSAMRLRAALMEAFNAAKDPMERLEIHRKIQGLPRNSAPNRVRNRCWATGKPRVSRFRPVPQPAARACSQRRTSWRGQVQLVISGLADKPTSHDAKRCMSTSFFMRYKARILAGTGQLFQSNDRMGLDRKT